MTLLDSLPASVELPAGGGKTWLLANTARQVVEGDGRALVLTHTNAGVHAVKAKLSESGVPVDSLHITTITSFAFEVVRSYSRIAGVTVPETPDWDDSTVYVEAATRVVGNGHICEVLALSFSHLLVDEYQDCSKIQHAFVLGLLQSIPAAAVFGDPLQSIFGFRDPVVDWSSDVLPTFKRYEIAHIPRRWEGHNEDLGAWLVAARTQLQPGSVFDLASGAASGVTFLQSTPQRFELLNAALEQRGPGETVVIVAPPDTASPRVIASKLRGVYSTMEEIGGSFMKERLTTLANLEPSDYALWLAEIAKECFVGYGKVDATVLGRLRKCTAVSSLTRPGLEQTLAVLDGVLAAPTLDALATAMRRLKAAKEARLHSHEAWGDVAAAIDLCADDAERELVAELAKLRERVRHGGRRPQRRVVSRTVLIKGLEFDHVIIANLERISDHCNLYVALTRARKSVTVIGTSARVTLTETRRSPNVRQARSGGKTR